MDNLSFGPQVFILNGQPVIIQRNVSVNTSVNEIINTDNITLQQNTVQDSTCSVNDQLVDSTNQLEDISGENLMPVHESSNGGDDCNTNEGYVAYVGDSDEDESSMIHLTLEQAAELGLHFDNESKLTTNDIPVTSSNDVIEVNKQLSSFNFFNKNSLITSNDNSDELELPVFGDRKLISIDSNCNSIEGGVSKGSLTLENGFKTTVDEPVLENINIDDSDQQLTLIPHFVNGTITYSVQINNTANNETVMKRIKGDNRNKSVLNTSLTKSTLNNHIVTSINDVDFNNTIKTFTTCSDLSSFVESKLGTTNSDLISTPTPLIHNSSQNLINNSGNVTLLSSGVIGDSTAKLSTSNFTPLSDLIKCSDNSNTLINKSNYNMLMNYQPISISQLLNNVNKKQTDKDFTTCSPLVSNVMNANIASSSSVIGTTGGSTIDNLKNKVTLLKNTVCSSSAIILNTPNKTNFTIANDTDSVLIPISINAKPMVTPSTSVLPNVVTSVSDVSCGKSANINTSTSNSTIDEDDLSNLIRIKSSSNPSTLIRNSVVNVDNTQSNISLNSINDFRLSTVMYVAANTSKMNKTLINRGTLSSGLLTELNKNVQKTTSISKSLLKDSNIQETQVNINQQLPLNSSLSNNRTISTTSTTISTTTASNSTINTTTVDTVSNSVTTANANASTPLVKAIKTCILPKEVSAALSKLPLLNDTNKPLGSSENPIQLVQQGHTFHSAQSLTEDQLRQITTVLQQNNLSTNVPAKNILYDAETNTKIIYRVVYPEEFDLKEASTSGDENNGKGRKRGRPSVKSIMKDSLSQDENNAAAKRKQPLPRTRSGRLSRPPRYMVRDYKRIKRSELDDSDGAYSDYQSDHEEECTTEDKNLLPGLLLPQKRNISSTFRCPTCNKIYLGYRRMAHHFNKYSDHGTEEYLLQLKKACETKQVSYGSATPATLLGATKVITPHNNNINNVNTTYNGVVSNSAAQPFTNPANIMTSTTVVPAKTTSTSSVSNLVTSSEDVTNRISASLSDLGRRDVSNVNGIISMNRNGAKNGVKIGIGFGKRRGRRKNGKAFGGVGGVGVAGGADGSIFDMSKPVAKHLNPEELKTRLKELLELCDVSELVQIAGPAVCRVLSTWELLMLRIDSTCTPLSRVSMLCNEIKDLTSKFKSLAGSLFHPVDNIIKTSANKCNSNFVRFEMDDKMLSNILGVPCGVYEIDDSLLKTDKIINSPRSPKPLINNCDADTKIVSIVPEIKKSVDIICAELPSIKSLEESTRCDISSRLDCGQSNTNSNLEDNQVSNSDASRNVNVTSLTSGQFLLTNESSMLCDERGTGLDDSVDQIVNEQLKNLTSSPQNHHHHHQEDLCKADVDELMKNFSVLEDHHHHDPHRNHHHISHDNHHQNGMVRIRSVADSLDPSEDDLMDGFTSITNQRTHVSASTEDLIKSLENFSSELHNAACDDDTSRQGFINTNDNFNDRVVDVNVANVNVVDTLDFEVLSQDFHHTTNVNQQ